jgi:hypothetical protein
VEVIQRSDLLQYHHHQMIFHHAIIQFLLAQMASSRILDTSSPDEHITDDLLKLDPHGRGQLRSLSASIEGSAIRGLAVANNGEE